MQLQTSSDRINPLAEPIDELTNLLKEKRQYYTSVN